MAFSICFVTLNAYGLFQPSGTQHIGGAEVQQIELARWLAQRGHRVVFVTKDQGASMLPEVDGIQLSRAYAADDGLPIVRMVYPRWWKLTKALRLAGTDVYYQRSAGIETGQVALWCRRHSRHFVYATASEADCYPDVQFIQRGFERRIYRWGLSHAQTVLAQTTRQAELLKQHYDIDAAIVPNAFDPTSIAHTPPPPTSQRPRFCWVGRFADVKRLDWFLDIAEARPEYDFCVIGRPNPAYTQNQALLDRLTALPNADHVPHLPREMIASAYAQCNALICTSSVEGFPNTFLESWFVGRPVITTYDPGQIVTNHQELGWVADQRDSLLVAVDSAARQSDDQRRSTAAKVRAFAESNHAQNVVWPRLETLIDAAVSGGTDV